MACPGDRLAAAGFRQAAHQSLSPKSERPAPRLEPSLTAPRRPCARAIRTCAGARWRESSAGRCRQRDKDTPVDDELQPRSSWHQATRSPRVAGDERKASLPRSSEARRDRQSRSTRARPAGARQARQCRAPQPLRIAVSLAPDNPELASNLTKCPARPRTSSRQLHRSGRDEDGTESGLRQPNRTPARSSPARGQVYDKWRIAFVGRTCARRRDGQEGRLLTPDNPAIGYPCPFLRPKPA